MSYWIVAHYWSNYSKKNEKRTIISYRNWTFKCLYKNWVNTIGAYELTTSYPIHNLRSARTGYYVVWNYGCLWISKMFQWYSDSEIWIPQKRKKCMHDTVTQFAKMNRIWSHVAFSPNFFYQPVSKHGNGILFSSWVLATQEIIWI